MDIKTTRGLLAGSAMMWALASATQGFAEERTFRFDLPSEPLSKALQEFGRITHEQLGFTPAQTAGRSTAPIHGDLDAATALKDILAGSQLSAERTATGAWLIVGGVDAAGTKPPPQTDAGASQLQEVVVTAQRSKENLQKVPINVAAFSASQLASSGVQSTTDLSTLVPGLDFTQGIGLGTPYLRGVGTTVNGVGSENEVALYIDDVYMGSKGAAIDELLDIAQVEVLKGPQGTLFGRNATGGLIQITTLDPKSEFGGFIKVGYGNYDTLTSDFYLTGPITSTLAFSLSAFDINQNDGWGKNLATGAPANLAKQGGARLKLLWTPDSLTKVTLEGDFSSIRSDIGNAYRGVYGALSAHGPLYTGGLYDDESTLDPAVSSNAEGLSLKVDRKVGLLTFDSITAVRETTYAALANIDGVPGALLDAHLSAPEHQISQEFRLTGQEDFGLRWQVGTYLYFAGGEEEEDIYGRSLGTIADEKIVGSQDTQSYAVYGQGTQSLGHDTRLTLGLRYTDEDREQTGHEDIYRTSGLATQIATVDRSTSFDAPTWRVSLDHDFTSDVMGFVSYNRGFKSGGYNPTALTTPAVRPETIDAYETGLKSQWFDRRFRLNASVFYYDWRDIQLQTNINGVGFLSNAASAKLYGLDVDFMAQLTANLRLSGALENMRGTFASYPNALDAVPNPLGGNLSPVFNATGRQLPYDPHFSGNLSLDYGAPTSIGDFDADITVRYNGGYYPEINNLLFQRSFTVLNSTVNWTFADGKYVLSLWGRNLTNQFYTLALTAQAAGSALSAAPPRTYGASLQVKF